MGLVINTKELSYWSQRSYSAAEVQSFWENVPESNHLAALFWDGKEKLSVKAHSEVYQPYLVTVVDYLSKLLPSLVPIQGSFLLCFHDAIWRQISDSVPVIGFGKTVDDKVSLLMPDPHFIGSDGYRDDLKAIRELNLTVPWERRIAGAFWRGTSTGLPAITWETWRDNPRIKLALLAKQIGDTQLLNASLSEVNQCEDSALKNEIAKADLVKGVYPFYDFGAYRYQINIDGNSCAWSYFVKLAMDAVVLKVESKHLQWYYEFLRPYEHFIPVKEDLTDLLEKIIWAKKEEARALDIRDRAHRIIAENEFAPLSLSVGEMFRTLFASQR